MKILKQKTCEGCLAVCLMALLDYQKQIKLGEDEEYTILFEGLRTGIQDFSTGHLIYLGKRFPDIIFEQYIDNFGFYEQLRGLQLPENVNLQYQEINLKFLERIVNESPIVVYLDDYPIWKGCHSPHFVMLSYLDNEKAIIHDPLVGREVKLETTKLIESISSLRNHLRICPKVIRIL